MGIAGELKTCRLELMIRAASMVANVAQQLQFSTAGLN